MFQIVAKPTTFLLAQRQSVCSSSPAAPAQQIIKKCSIFPANNIWNRRIDTLPLDPNSATYVSTIGAATRFHPDVGNDINSFGIPYNLKGSGKVMPEFDYADESDPGPYPASDQTANRGRHSGRLRTTETGMYSLSTPAKRYCTSSTTRSLSGEKGIHAGSRRHLLLLLQMLCAQTDGHLQMLPGCRSSLTPQLR